MIYLTIYFSAIFGAFISRIHGGWLNVPRWITNIVYALPFVFTANVFLFRALAFVNSLAGISTGHGRGQSLKLPLTGDPEILEAVTLWAQPLLPVYWYKVLILAVSGVLITSGGIIGFISCHNFIGAGLLFLAGLMKPLAYIIGWYIYPNSSGPGIINLNHATEIGEFLTGLFMGFCLSLSFGLS